MNASLDTNVIIHLYEAGLESILFNRFNNIYVYEFIRNQELINHAKPEIIKLFDKDIALGKIKLVTDII